MSWKGGSSGAQSESGRLALGLLVSILLMVYRVTYPAVSGSKGATETNPCPQMVSRILLV